MPKDPFLPFDPKTEYVCRCSGGKFDCASKPDGYTIKKGRALWRHREEQFRLTQGDKYGPTDRDGVQDVTGYTIEYAKDLPKGK